MLMPSVTARHDRSPWGTGAVGASEAVRASGAVGAVRASGAIATSRHVV